MTGYASVDGQNTMIAYSRFTTVGLFILLSGGGLANRADLAIGAEPTKPPMTVVTLARVARRQVAAEATLVATVRPLRTSVVGSGVEGRVVEFLAAGDESQPKVTHVRQGQPLARLRTRTIEIELAAARAELQLREQTYAELVHGSRPEEIAQAVAKQQAARAHMDYAQAKYQRRKLSEKEDRGIVSGEELDSARADAIAAEQAYHEASAACKLVKDGPRPERIAQQQARVLAQKEEIRRLEDVLQKYTIRAPFDGYVTQEFTEIGAWLSRGDPVAEVIQLDQVELEAFVPERFILATRIGMETQVTVEAIPGREFTGWVTRLIAQADTRSRTFPVKIRVDNPQHEGGRLLKSGMLARVVIPVGQPESVLLVPKDAVVLGGPTPRIVVVQEEQGLEGNLAGRQVTVDPIDVKLGAAFDGLIQIEGKVQEGQWVVVQGNERLRAGQVVRVMRENLSGG